LDCQGYRSFLGDWVERHYTVQARTPAEAAAAMRKTAHGRVNIVGYIDNGREHRYPEPLKV
jgi:hypothetical protein